MIKHLQQIKNHPLFYRMTENDIIKIFSCFSFQEKKYLKGEYILLEGNPVKMIGIILKGTILIEKDDVSGNICFFMELQQNEIFAESFMNYEVLPSSVNYKAITDCSILYFNYKDIWKLCENNCSCHPIFTENLMNLLALKSRSFMLKVEILSKKSLRERILTFLSTQRQGHNEFFIPYNHTEMAEYLGVNRSALVRELTRMKKERIINYHKNMYTLLN